jgi:putative FmdB family regulatory protein
MPLYEYHCSECDQSFEKMVRFSEVNLSPECPHCHSRETHKQISTFAARVAGATAASSASNCSSGSSRFR